MFVGNPLIQVRWKDHASVMVSNFIKLLQQEQCVDVYIRHAGRTIPAHRAVLASSSELFRARLASPAAVTVLELGSLSCAAGLLRAKGLDVVFAELELIVHIVYHGRADLRELSIASVLDTARCLQFADVCEVLQRTVQARAHTQPPAHQLQHVQQLLPYSAGAECLEQLVVGEVALRALQEVMLAPSCLLAPELTEELTHLTPLMPVPVERQADPPPPPPDCGLRHEDAAGLTAAGLCERDPPMPDCGLRHEDAAGLTAAGLCERDPPMPDCGLRHEDAAGLTAAGLCEPEPVPPGCGLRHEDTAGLTAAGLCERDPPMSDCGLRHEDAAGLTAAGLCEQVVQPPPMVELAHDPPLSAVFAAGGAAEHFTEAAHQERHHEQGQQQQQAQEQEQERLHGSQDGAPLLRVRTQFELHCPWGLDMELAGRQQHEPQQGSGLWSEMLMPPPPPPPPPPAAPRAASPLVPEDEQAIIDSCGGLPPSTPETLERFDENDFSGLTEEEKSPMPPKAARVRRFRRRAVPRVRTRKLPALISLDQSTVCQVCHVDFGRMAKLQRHLASEHADRAAAAAPADERPAVSTVDASAIADPRDTCASVLRFRPRLTAEAAAGGAAGSVGGELQRAGGGGSAGGGGVTPAGGGAAPAGGGGGTDVWVPRTEREAVVGMEAGLVTAVLAAPEGGDGGTAAVLGRTRAGWQGDGGDPALVRREDDGTPPLVVAEQQGEQAGWTAATQQTGQADQADGPAKFKCVECSFSTAKMSLLGAHMRREHSPALVCPHCQLQFRQAVALYRHMANTHPDLPDRPSQCLLCSYQSGRPSQVRRHLRDVHGQDVQGRPLPLDHRCPHCDYATCSTIKLKKHVSRQHTTDKQFKCSECSYSSVEKQALDKHFRIVHTDERPYRCEICDFRASTLSRITRHRQSHTQQRPHVCATCGQRYADRRRLLEHVQLRHEPAAGASPFPFACHVCTKTFARRDNMVLHERKVHKLDEAVS